MIVTPARAFIAGVAVIILAAIGAQAAAPLPAAADPADPASVLIPNREEERVARDLYLAFDEMYGVAPFAQIARSEQHHFDSVGAMLAEAGLEDPSAGRPAGDYAFDEFDQLYAGWLAAGSESVEAAYQVAMELEQRDIDDLQAALDSVDDPSIEGLLTALQNASQRHLTAFTNAANGTMPSQGGMWQVNNQRPGWANSPGPGDGPTRPRPWETNGPGGPNR